MKSRVTLTLIESVIMVLVFSIAVAVCLKVFVYADGISKDTEQYVKAHEMVRNAAEVIKYTGGDFDGAAEILGCSCSEGVIENSEDGIVMKARCEDTGYDCLGGAYITASSGEELICDMHIRWQEDEA